MSTTITSTEPSHPSVVSTSPSGSRQNSPPVELRRITSNNNMTNAQREHRLSVRASQHLQTAPRLGSRSPASIPSSPTSVHSSSSAIFERDIEPMAPSPPMHSQNPHFMPRSKGTESIEQSVPSVLDSAAAVLASTSPEDEDFVSVLAPAPEVMNDFSSGLASPIGSSRSRSPSPGAVGNRTSLLLNLPSPTPNSSRSTATTGTASPGPSSPVRPTIQTQSQTQSQVVFPDTSSQQPLQPLSLSTPTSAYFSVASMSSAGSSPTTTTLEHPLESFPTPTSAAVSPNLTSASTSPSAAPLSIVGSTNPPSPKHSANKRLSFMSYADLLSSTPTSTLTLSSLTSSAQASEPPPHIPTVTGFAQAQAQAQGHSAASSIHHGIGPGLVNLKERPLDPVLLEGDGGEWEREGLGRGLEERLEALMMVGGKS